MQRRTTHPLRIASAASALAIGALLLAGCTGTSSNSGIDASAPKALKGTVSLWHFFTGREAGVIQSAVDDFEKANPGVKVDVKSGQDDDKLQKVISSGGNIDVGLSYSTAIVGKFCSSGAFVNLNPYIERDKVDVADIPQKVSDYTVYKGNRCTLPALTDTSALMYNVQLLADAGISGPPKTLTELADDAVKLTTYNPDGSIKVLGFNPLIGFYENQVLHMAPMTGATFLDKDGKSNYATNPAWAKVMTWQKALVDKIGYGKLQKFTAGLGQEFSADNAFQTGKVAINIDGEYRTAFIADQAPKFDYATAPMPVADDQPDLYGAGSMGGNVIGIAKGSQHKELAWALIKYLALNTDGVVKMANGLKNVPTIKSALNSPALEVSPQYKVFVDVALNPKTITNPSTNDGGAYSQALTDFWTKYQSGAVPDLAAGLKQLDIQVNDALALAGQ